MPEHVLMTEIEIIADGGRRRWKAAVKLRIVEETLDDRASISIVARRNGVAPNLLYRLRRVMLEGGSVAATEDNDVTSNKIVRQMKDRIRELERHLGRKTLEVEILREALDKFTLKKAHVARAVAAQGRFPVKAVAETLGVARSNLIGRLQGREKPRRRQHKARRSGGAVDHRNCHGATDLWLPPDHRDPEPAAAIGRGCAHNRKRVYRIMRVRNL